MKLIKQERRPSDWDQRIQHFPNKSLYHESAWLDFITATYPIRAVDYFQIEHRSDVVGYFCAMRSEKLGLSLWETPQRSTYMGPLLYPEVDQEEVIHLILSGCKRERISHLVLTDDWLNPDVMNRVGFRQENEVTHVCPLHGGAEGVWGRMHGNCRTRIRKAEKSGLEVEVAEDASFVDDFYSRFVRSLARKGFRPCYSEEHAKKLFHYLGRADRLFALRVKHEGKVIGTAFYPHDDRAMYFGDAGYDPESLALCPNNLLHWTAIKMAIDRSIPIFNMGGGPQPSRFTQTFGGTLQPLVRYHKSFVPLLDQVRRMYHFLEGRRSGLLVFYRKLPHQWRELFSYRNNHCY